MGVVGSLVICSVVLAMVVDVSSTVLVAAASFSTQFAIVSTVVVSLKLQTFPYAMLYSRSARTVEISYSLLITVKSEMLSRPYHPRPRPPKSGLERP